MDRLPSVIASEVSFRRPVTAAIDITTIPYYGDVEEMPMVTGTKDGEGGVQIRHTLDCRMEYPAHPGCRAGA